MTADRAQADDFERRHVPFEACWNFRDIGGYATPGGALVWGRYYRAGALEDMTAADRVRLRELGVATVIDLRRPAEVAPRNGHPAAEIGARYVHLPPLPDGASEELDRRLGPGISGARYLGYLEYAGESFREIFDRLADPATYPLVLHCTAGKDRTGVVTALAMTVAGVDRATIVADFALSNRDTERRLGWLAAHQRAPAGDHPDELRRRFGVPVEAITTFLAGLDARFGGVGGYLRTIGVSESTVRGVAEALHGSVGRMSR